MTVVHILALAQLSEIGIEWYEGIGRAKVQRVVDTPVDLWRQQCQKWKCDVKSNGSPLELSSPGGTILGERN